VTHRRKMMLEELQRRNYSENTIRCYIRTVEDFSREGRESYARERHEVNRSGCSYRRCLQGITPRERQAETVLPVECLLDSKAF
jgi:hypothetical protein